MEHGEGCGSSPLRPVSRDDPARSRKSITHRAIAPSAAPKAKVTTTARRLFMIDSDPLFPQ